MKKKPELGVSVNMKVISQLCACRLHSVHSRTPHILSFIEVPAPSIIHPLSLLHALDSNSAYT
jgi:hypothetical protein